MSSTLKDLFPTYEVVFLYCVSVALWSKKNRVSVVQLVFSMILSLCLCRSAISAEALKLGVIVPLTGPSATMGESLAGVIKLLKNNVIDFSFEDDQCDAKKALSAYLKLRDQGVQIFYIGCSGSILAVTPHAKRNGDLVLTTSAGSSRIRDSGDEVIRLNPDAVSVAEGIKGIIQADNLPLAVLYEEQEYASSLADHIEQLLGQAVIKRVSYRPDSNSYLGEILSIKQHNPKSILLIPVADGPARTILKQLSQARIAADILGEVNLCDFPFKPADFGLHGWCLAAQFHGENYLRFIEQYNQKVGHPSAFPFYDAMALDLFQFLEQLALDSASDLSANTIKKRILSGFNGSFAEYKFSSSGEITNTLDYLVTTKY